MEQIRPNVTSKQLIISVAASVHTSQIEKALDTEVAVVRAMPNTPCVLGVGMTALCKGRFVDPQQVQAACELFDVVGRTVVVDEKHMDAVTGLSASGPAYIYIILESLAEAGVKVGLPRDISTLLAAQTTLGAATVVLPNRRSPGAFERLRHHSRRLHRGRNHGAGRRKTAGHPDQGGGQSDATGQRTRLQLT